MYTIYSDIHEYTQGKYVHTQVSKYTGVYIIVLN